MSAQPLLLGPSPWDGIMPTALHAACLAKSEELSSRVQSQAGPPGGRRDGSPTQETSPGSRLNGRGTGSMGPAVPPSVVPAEPISKTGAEPLASRAPAAFGGQGSAFLASLGSHCSLDPRNGSPLHLEADAGQPPVQVPARARLTQNASQIQKELAAFFTGSIITEYKDGARTRPRIAAGSLLGATTLQWTLP